MLTIALPSFSLIEPLREFVFEAWGWEMQGTDTEKEALTTLYTTGAISQAMYARVAWKDNKLCGIICGKYYSLTEKAIGEPYLTPFQNACNTLKQTESGQKIFDHVNELAQASSNAMRDIRAKGVGYDAELSFLVVPRAFQRQGIARAMESEYFGFLREKGLKRCAVITDTHSTWQYYEKGGWTLRNEVHFPQDLTQKIFIYTKPIQGN